MNRLGIESLNAGASDLRLTGEHNRGSYVQRRRAQMAGGGITNARQGYFLGGVTDFISDLIPNEIKDPIAKLIPNELKNPLGATAAAVAANYLPTVFDKPTVLSQLGEKFPTVLGDESLIGRGIEAGKQILEPVTSGIGSIIKGPDDEFQLSDILGIPGRGIEALGNIFPESLTKVTSKDPSVLRQIANIGVPLAVGKWAHDVQEDYLKKQPPFPADETGITFQTAAEAMADPNLRFKPQAQYANVAEGGRIGYDTGNTVVDTESSEYKAWKNLYTSGNTDMAQEYHPNHEIYKKHLEGEAKAQGGRIGYANGGDDPQAQLMAAYKKYKSMGGTMTLEEFAPLWAKGGMAKGGRIGYALGTRKKQNMLIAFDKYKSTGGGKTFVEWVNDVWLPNAGAGSAMAEIPTDWPYGYAKASDILSPESVRIPPTKEEPLDIEDWLQKYAQGGRVPAQEGGLMDLGGMEKDYRQEGGFVPIGGEEKADDVPARLSKNEFVFTADAVRAAGGGDIDEGAAVMERLMENLEAGGTVSEESQGLEGAREMFATAQELEKRII